jgi:stage II sporulation protein D (peptidoglycan lytic transglycosylase)
VQMPARVHTQAVTIRFIAALIVAAALVGVRAPAQTDISDAVLEKASEGHTVDIGLLSSAGGVATLPLEVYVARVLAGEAEPGAADAAQQALAVAVRTYAIVNLGRHRREGFDLCDSTHCQVVKPATAVARRAALATSGMVLLNAAGQPATVFYSASCGGRLERASQVWPGAVDLSQPERDEADAGDPPWLSEIRVSEVERALRAAGLRGGRLRNLRVVQRNQSGRVVRMHVDGLSPNGISGTDFRMAVGRVSGWQLVKSTAFDVDRTGNGYRFRGRGFGHGVGLCVVGAGARARGGDSAEQILRFYFPSLTVGRAGGAPPLRTETGTVPVTAGTVPVTLVDSARDVQIALPVSEEHERASVLALVRRARDEMAAVTAQKPPAALRLTVHPTVESFGRATGQPWWVSGATNGANIDLLPISILQQQGQLERTVRHEVAHALLDSTLASRPMWVREGAAIYFSSPRESGGASRQSPGRVTCPTDEELLRPVSAGAQRDAYARAAACFARQIGAGRKWNDVK